MPIFGLWQETGASGETQKMPQAVTTNSLHTHNIFRPYSINIHVRRELSQDSMNPSGKKHTITD